MARSIPYRRFTHPDGRQWEIRLVGSVVELRITSDGETVERKRKFDAPVLGANDLDASVREQLAEGFTEQTPPEWKTRLDELVTFWEADDPGFDADVLRSQLLEKGEAVAKEMMDKLTWWEAGQPRDPQVSRKWLLANVDSVLAGLLLALRWPEHQVLISVDALLAELKEPGILEALMSLVEHPMPNGPDRPSHLPLAALLSMGKPDQDTASRLAHALDSDDFRVRDVAAKVLAEFSDDEALFALLYRKRTAAKESDGTCWAMMRAAEVSKRSELRDFLLWMQKSPRFKNSPGYPERIGNALAHLKNR